MSGKGYDWLDEDEELGVIALDPEPQPERIKNFEELVQEDSNISLNSLKTYFDVDTSTVLQRLKKTLKPFSSSFFEEKAPDLYIPFWGTTTLILVMAAAGNLGVYMENGLAWHSQASKVITATWLLYSLLLGVPFACYCLLSNSGSGVTLLHLVCLYGYSLVPFIPAAVLCVIPLKLLRWFMMLGAFAWSSCLLLKNVWPEIQSVMATKKYFAGGLLLSGHFVLALTANLYFFT